MINKRYRIISDGTGIGTKILGEDGERIDMGNICSIEWTIDAQSGCAIAKVVTLLFGVEADLMGTVNGGSS